MNPGIWVYRTETEELLGITGPGLLLLQRDLGFRPDCQACGRIRWKRSEVLARREQLRGWLADHHPQFVLDLKQSV